jgi:hypothetical protein
MGLSNPRASQAGPHLAVPHDGPPGPAMQKTYSKNPCCYRSFSHKIGSVRPGSLGLGLEGLEYTPGNRHMRQL